MNAQKKIPIHLSADSRLLIIGDCPVSSHEIVSEIGRGANGIVYAAKNKLLERKEAIKVWTNLRDGDRRDKLEQGIAEAKKLANANPEHAVQIYSISVLCNTPVAFMEYIDGETLLKFKGNCTNLNTLHGLSHLYLNAIENTSTSLSMHGDPHLSNVLVYLWSQDRYQEALRIKLCDFGTSTFAGKAFSAERHWRIVEESILKLTDGFSLASEAKEALQRNKATASGWTKDTDGTPRLSDFDKARLRIAPLRDYLHHLSVELQ